MSLGHLGKLTVGVTDFEGSSRNWAADAPGDPRGPVAIDLDVTSAIHRHGDRAVGTVR